MALSKKFRMHRQVPSFYIMATCAVVIALFLIGFWMLLPSSQMAPQDSYLVKDGLPPQRQGIADQAFEKRAKAEENAANSSPKETDDAPSKINARETNNVVKDKSESSQDDQAGRADGRNETARDKENNEDIDGVNETSESSQDDKADKGDETTEKDNKNSDAEDNEDENVEKDSSESSPDNRTEKAEQKSGEASDNSDEDNNEDDDGVKETSASSQNIKVDKAEGTTEDLKDKSAEQARVASDSTDTESNDEENLVKDTLKSAHYDPVAKPGKEVKDEERLETGTKIENSTTIAAQFELTTENEEIPKNWTTQAVESKEEIELVNIIEERDRESTKKEWNNDKKDQQEQSHNEQKTNQEAVETDKKIINDTVPEVTIAADSELANGNEETPGNRTSQSSESKEEKELIKPQVQEEHGNENKEWQEQLQDEQNRNEQSIKVKSEEQSQNEQKTQQQSAEEKTEQQKVNLQNQQKSEEQIIEGKRDQPVAKETSEKTGVGAERGEKNKATIQKSLPGGRGKTGDGNSFNWKICKWKGAEDYIPCLDNMAAIRLLPSRKHFEHRERHCPSLENFPSCLVPLPPGYNVTFPWPLSREQVRFSNVPHPKLASYKQDQNWMKISADKERILFPGGGTQFKNGALDYINRIERDVPEIAWGNHTRVVLDVGCGVASFGGFLFEKDVLTMSFAPKDEHDAQVQLALERGIPAILAVMGTKRLVSPSNAYDLVHCARCRVHWQGDGGMLLIEINRLLRPGGYFVWSATPVYRKTPEDMKFWNDVIAIADALCWELKNKTWLHETGIGIAYFQKPISNACYSGRMKAYPPICGPDGKPDAAWYVPMGKCIHEIPTGSGIRASEWPPSWPKRLVSSMSWLTNSTKSLFGQPPAMEFQTNTEHWKRVIKESYFSHVGIDWSSIRNVMDMNAGYGGFAAALIRQPLWVMNVVPTFEPDTLPVIFDRGLFGVYHDWCESFNTYPRTYDLLHVDHLFKRLVSRCDPKLTLLEMDRILRPNGWIIFRETSIILEQIGPIIRSLHWQQMQPMLFEGGEGLMVARKDFWRPEVSSVG